METNNQLPRVRVLGNNGYSGHSLALPYVSPSRLKLWLKCPLAYKRRYIDEIQTPASPGLFLGKVVHSALEFFYRHRRRGVELFPDYVSEYVFRTWTAAVRAEGISFETSDEEQALKRQAAKLVETYLEQLPKDEGTPVFVEQRLVAPLIDPRTGENLGLKLVGVVDLVNDLDGPVIVDFKTAARASSQVDVIHELQLSCYSYLFRRVAETQEAGLEIRSLIKTKTPKVDVQHFAPRRDEHFDRLFTVIRAYLDSVVNSRFHIRPGIECSFCDFRESCLETTATAA